MKLLLDQNLSFNLISLLEEFFPGSAHVRDFNLQMATDLEIWDFAKKNNFAIIPKDADFRQRSFIFGAPPKIIFLKVGNSSTNEISTLIRKKIILLQEFIRNKTSSLLILSH